MNTTCASHPFQLRLALTGSWLVALTLCMSARADPAPASSADGRDYDTPRYEPAGFPLLAGNSDIGFELGAVGTLSHFENGIVPYRWNMDVVLALAVKGGPNGEEITQQSYQANVDIPELAGGQLRLNPQVMYARTVNQLYLGLGNASPSALSGGQTLRHFQFDDRQARVRELTRVSLPGAFDLMFATSYRYEDPHVYAGSKLETDALAGSIRGVRPLSLLGQAAGILYDGRDSEIFPRSGGYHHLGIRGALGLPVSHGVRYGALGARFSQYVPLGGPFVFALRVVADLQFGHVPFYDLSTGGSFLTDEMVGGSSAVRGVPVGRYSGLIKTFGNVELRAMWVHFRLLGQQFQLGNNLLFDAGRLWSDYSFRAPADGEGVGLKWGVGGGEYLQWGQAAVFRLEVAYSPDARSENPGLPLGIYVEDGVMF
jgi:hypothetical protein